MSVSIKCFIAFIVKPDYPDYRHRNNLVSFKKSSSIKAIKVHYFVPGSNKISNEFFLRI